MLYSISFDIKFVNDEDYRNKHTTLTNVIEGFDHIKPTDTYYFVDIDDDSPDSIYKFIKKECQGRIWETLFIISITSPFQGNVTYDENRWLNSKGITAA